MRQILCVLVAMTTIGFDAEGQARGAQPIVHPMTMSGKSPVYAPNGVAATSQPLATTAAIAVMQRGGNAIDGAIAAAAVLSVVEPMMTGIGGDVFAIVWSAKDKKLYGLNASGRGGSLMTREELVKRGRTRSLEKGPETVTVPGALAGWQTLLDRFGSMKLAQVLEPAIGYAENGFPVTPVIAGDWGSATSLARDPGMKETFLIDGTRVPRAGDWFRNPAYAKTLREIAAGGPDVMYKGPLGEKIVKFLQSKQGFLTMDDLKKNEPTWVTPISVVFKGYRVWEMPPNNLGIGVLEMLRILDGYDLKAMGNNSVAYLHHLIEAKKLAYADQAKYVGDADHLIVKPEYLLSDPFILSRRKLIDPTKAATQVTAGPERVGTETIYLTVADKDGNMVSFINSQFDLWGSMISAPGTGFSLHNRGSGFTVEAGFANTAAPGKRPAHTLIPGFVTRPGPTSAPDGTGDQPYMSFGLMGGSMQAQGHTQFLINHIVFGMDVQAAQDAARFRHNSGAAVVVESAIPENVLAGLRALGHTVSYARPGSFGGSQAIIKLPQGYVAGSDPRKDGHAAGY
jgi:gamma-glutamyltranspeptidase/glutathione hydrolase